MQPWLEIIAFVGCERLLCVELICNGVQADYVYGFALAMGMNTFHREVTFVA
jgi:hypothetical protein